MFAVHRNSKPLGSVVTCDKKYSSVKADNCDNRRARHTRQHTIWVGRYGGRVMVGAIGCKRHKSRDPVRIKRIIITAISARLIRRESVGGLPHIILLAELLKNWKLRIRKAISYQWLLSFRQKWDVDRSSGRQLRRTDYYKERYISIWTKRCDVKDRDPAFHCLYTVIEHGEFPKYPSLLIINENNNGQRKLTQFVTLWGDFLPFRRLLEQTSRAKSTNEPQM